EAAPAVRFEPLAGGCPLLGREFSELTDPAGPQGFEVLASVLHPTALGFDGEAFLVGDVHVGEGGRCCPKPWRWTGRRAGRGAEVGNRGPVNRERGPAGV